MKLYDVSNCEAIDGSNFTYQPDFWSQTLSAYIEIKSGWTFEVMTGCKKYNSHDSKVSKQLERIKLLRKTHNILLCVEIDKDFYFIDPANIHSGESIALLKVGCQNLLKA